MASKGKSIRKQYQRILACGVGSCAVDNPCKSCRKLYDDLDKDLRWDALADYYRDISLAERGKLSEERLANLLEDLSDDEQHDIFYMVCEELRKKNPFNRVLQSKWYCFRPGKWFKWVTKDMSEKEKEKQKRLEKERDEDFERRWAKAKTTGVLKPSKLDAV